MHKWNGWDTVTNRCLIEGSIANIKEEVEEEEERRDENRKRQNRGLEIIGTQILEDHLESSETMGGDKNKNQIIGAMETASQKLKSMNLIFTYMWMINQDSVEFMLFFSN